MEGSTQYFVCEQFVDVSSAWPVAPLPAGIDGGSDRLSVDSGLQRTHVCGGPPHVGETKPCRVMVACRRNQALPRGGRLSAKPSPAMFLQVCLPLPFLAPPTRLALPCIRLQTAYWEPLSKHVCNVCVCPAHPPGLPVSGDIVNNDQMQRKRDQQPALKLSSL